MDHRGSDDHRDRKQVQANDEGDPDGNNLLATASTKDGAPATANSSPTTMPNVLLVSSPKTVPSFQCRQTNSPPATMTSNDRTEPP
jgi:hypothetical protein